MNQKTKEQKKLRKEAAVDKAVEFKKDALVVFELLDTQIASIPNERKKLTKEDTAETWKTVGMALDMFEQMCRGLRKDLENTLKKASK